MTKKLKISDAAKDFNVSVQEIIDFFAAKDNKKRNASSTLNEAEMNLLLEHYTKKHEVKNFGEYYQSRSDEKPSKKDDTSRQERKSSGKKSEKSSKQSAPARKADKKTDTPAPKNLKINP